VKCPLKHGTALVGPVSHLLLDARSRNVAKVADGRVDGGQKIDLGIFNVWLRRGERNDLSHAVSCRRITH
jgi:hypothetical protein